MSMKVRPVISVKVKARKEERVTINVKSWGTIAFFLALWPIRKTRK